MQVKWLLPIACIMGAIKKTVFFLLQAETPGVTHFGAYHRPPDGHFLELSHPPIYSLFPGWWLSSEKYLRFSKKYPAWSLELG